MHWRQRTLFVLLILGLGKVQPFSPPTLRRHYNSGSPHWKSSWHDRLGSQNPCINLPGKPESSVLLQQHVSEEAQLDQQPIMARACSRIIKLGLGCILTPLGVGKVEGLSVHIKAASNRAILLGRIEDLSIRWDRIRSSPLVQQSRGFDMQGKDLRLGAYPALCFLIPSFLLLFLASARIRALSRLPILFGLVCSVTDLQPRRAVQKWWTEREDGIVTKPKKRELSVLTYRLAFSGEDLSARNTLVRLSLRRAMEQLLKSSMMGVALSAASVTMNRSNKKTLNEAVTQEQQLSELMTALEANDANTTIELKKVTIGKAGKLLLDASTQFPQPTAGVDQSLPLMSTVDFVVRVSVSPLDGSRFQDVSDSPFPARNSLALAQSDDGGRAGEGGARNKVTKRTNKSGIMLGDAELKASFNKETELGAIVPMEIFGTPIPDVWVPIVSGAVAFPFARRRHRVTSVESQRSEDGSVGEDRIDVCGEIYFGGDPPTLSDGWKMPFRRDANRLSASPPPRRRLPPSPNLPLLTPGS